jgi:hypothetical protein
VRNVASLDVAGFADALQEAAATFAPTCGEPGWRRLSKLAPHDREVAARVERLRGQLN